MIFAGKPGARSLGNGAAKTYFVRHFRLGDLGLFLSWVNMPKQ